MKKIRLLLIEDNRLLREGLLAMLKGQRDIAIVASVGRREDTLFTIHQLKPNVILVDLSLRSLNSLHVVQQVKKEIRKAKVIVFDLAPVQGDIMQFVKAGASGFVLKNTTSAEFLTTIRTVARGEKVLPPLSVESLFAHIVKHAVSTGKVKLKKALRMTGRERQIVGLVGQGLSNNEIGRKLHISTRAVVSHIHNIMEKLALHTRPEIADFPRDNRDRRRSGDRHTNTPDR